MTNKLVDVGSFQVASVVPAGDWPKYHSSPIVSTPSALPLALGSTLSSTVARALATVFNLSPLSILALDLFIQKYVSKHDVIFEVIC